jgi:hypothetical protein
MAPEALKFGLIILGLGLICFLVLVTTLGTLYRFEPNSDSTFGMGADWSRRLDVCDFTSGSPCQQIQSSRRQRRAFDA